MAHVETRTRQFPFFTLLVAATVLGLTGNASADLAVSDDLGAGEIHIFAFTSSDGATATGSWTAPAGLSYIEVLVVAGGGAGSSGGNAGRDSGGGAGGLLHATITPSGTYSITVGAGGTPGLGTMENGSDSVFGSLVALGGGGGGWWDNTYPGGTAGGTAPGQVGSGGGGGENSYGAYGTPGQGNDGSGKQGQAGGGGGAGGGWSRAPEYLGGTNCSMVGGIGLDCSGIFGTSVGASGWFAGGGNSTGTGAAAPPGGGGANGVNGTAGSGGGGGARARGGSGVVVVKYSACGAIVIIR